MTFADTWAAVTTVGRTNITAIAPHSMDALTMMGKLIADDPCWKFGVHIKKINAGAFVPYKSSPTFLRSGIVLLSYSI